MALELAQRKRLVTSFFSKSTVLFVNLINEKFDNKYIILIDKIIQLANDIEEFNWKDFHLKNLMKDANENWKIIDLQQNWF